RAMIVGIPNVGKSSLINRLAKRSVAQTGDRPGVTKSQQWIKTGKILDLLDTPGILWPKFEEERVGYLLAATGAIRDEILDIYDVALFTLKIMKERYEKRLVERYGLEEGASDPLQILEEIGRKRGILRRGGEVDMERSADLFLKELRSGKLGPISLESPGDAGVLKE
ncbi:MAG: ribosome biogenesis GTPase YlqF, partial [Thermicanus sp.]|nr:ribosome biogenesis GTPase YlqF [Thermicanus sp.]